MAGREFKEYTGLSRNVITNKLFTSLSGQGNTISFRHQFKGLLEESILKWIFNNGKTPQPHAYAVTEDPSIYHFDGPAKIVLAADWASDTVQSEKIAELMAGKQADYTIHLGDTYYSGGTDEITANFNQGPWPLGKIRSFALLGNHEMYSGGFPFFEALMPYLKQPNPFFCLGNAHWCILGLDTGYQSILGGPSNTHLDFEQNMYDWLSNIVRLGNDTRGIIVLTHHQYITAFKNEDNFQLPAGRLQGFFGDDREIIWIWGHEHRFSMYGKYKAPVASTGEKFVGAYGRCIGHGGMPVEQTGKHAADTSKARQYNLVLYDGRVADTVPAFPFKKIPVGYNGYAMMEINEEILSISYFQSYTSDANAVPAEELVVRETWSADNSNGKISCLKTEDLTADPATGESRLTFAEGASIATIGNQAL